MAVYRPDLDLLKVQIRSLQAQTLSNWTCLVGIDGPDPQASACLRQLCAEDDRFEIHHFGHNVGVYRHFERLLRLVPDDVRWVSLADQDDRWDTDKFERLLPSLWEDGVTAVTGQARIVAAEGSLHGTTTRRPGSAFETLLINQMTGCLSIIRREVLDRALPFPNGTEVALHDHWLAVCASATGRVALVDEPVQDYVQHAGNVLGEARPVSLTDSVERVRGLGGARAALDGFTAVQWGLRVSMARALVERGMGDSHAVSLVAGGRLRPQMAARLGGAWLRGGISGRNATAFVFAAAWWPRRLGQDEWQGTSRQHGCRRRRALERKAAVTARDGAAVSAGEFRSEEVTVCPLCDGSKLKSWRSNCADSTGIPVRLDYLRCQDCGCRVLARRATESDVGQFYGETYAPYSGETDAVSRALVGGGAGPLQEKLASVYQRFTGVNQRVLDFGCGSATFVNTARSAGWQTVAADFSEQGLHSARESGHEVRLVDERFWQWLPTQEFDVIRLSHVIEHLYSPRQQLETLLGSLKPGGILHVITPEPEGPACLLARRHSNFYQLVHVTLIPSRTLLRLVKRLGVSGSVIVPEATIKDVWRSCLLASRRVRSYEGAPQSPSTRVGRLLLQVFVAAFARAGRSDRYHAFLVR